MGKCISISQCFAPTIINGLIAEKFEKKESKL